jgi:hypothetical protein
MDRVNDESVILSPDLYVSEATLKYLMDFPTLLYKGEEWEYQGLNSYPLSDKKGGMTSVKLIKKKLWARNGAPTMPLNHIIDSNSDGNLSLSWDSSTDDVAVTGYRVYLDGYLVFTQTNINILSYQHSGLISNQNYYFGVSAIDGDGNESEISWINDNAAIYMQPPANLIISTIRETSMQLSWDASVDASVDLYRLTIDGVFVSDINTASSNYTFTGLTNGQTYVLGVSYVVSGIYTSAESTASATTATSVTYVNFSTSLNYPTKAMACGSTDNNNSFWHDGISTYPVAGDRVRTTSGFTVDVNDGWYKIIGTTEVMQIVSGLVNVKSLCP